MSVVGNLFKAKDRQRILTRLAALDPSAPAKWGRMSAHQAVCHQADALRMAVGRTTVESVKPPMNPAILRFVAFTLPIAWPQGVKTVREADQDKDGTPPVDFEQDRDDLVALIDEFHGLPVDRPTHPHPIFGALSRKNWGRWAYRHSDHHLRQFGA